MLKKLAIITTPLYDFKGQKFNIGGVEHYMRTLAHIGFLRGLSVEVFQRGDFEEKKDFGEFKVESVNVSSNQKLFDYACSKAGEDSVVVIATDQMDIKSRAKNAVVIQHGIAFDYPLNSTGLAWHKDVFIKFLRCIKNVMRARFVKNVVCVDYNFFNWFRTLSSFDKDSNVWIIPNYSCGAISESELKSKLGGRSGKLRILFARRFVEYRGTVIFKNIAKRLLSEFDNLEFTFAGDGPLKPMLEGEFKNEPRVCITKYNSLESVEFHKNFDIACVPTITSEGTSLSLLEAMSAGCFPIATHVGGMTNIILDSYNGFLCYPKEEAVYGALKKAVLMKKPDFDRIATNAWLSATQSFGLSNWSEKWNAVFDSIQ